MSEEAQVALLLSDKLEEEEFDTYCITCKRPTCTKCIKTEHQGNDFDTIPKLYRKIKNRRLDLLREMEKKINPVRINNKRHLRNVQFRNETIKKQNLQNVEKKRTELLKAVNEIMDCHVEIINANSNLLKVEIDKAMQKEKEDELAVHKLRDTF